MMLNTLKLGCQRNILQKMWRQGKSDCTVVFRRLLQFSLCKYFIFGWKNNFFTCDLHEQRYFLFPFYIIIDHQFHDMANATYLVWKQQKYCWYKTFMLYTLLSESAIRENSVGSFTPVMNKIMTFFLSQ